EPHLNSTLKKPVHEALRQHPMGRFILFVHTPLPFPAAITLCVQRPAFVTATFTIEGLIVDSS
ncbi:hypothetical protein, partial [uncultured Acetatifactor sp.]